MRLGMCLGVQCLGVCLGICLGLRLYPLRQRPRENVYVYYLFLRIKRTKSYAVCQGVEDVFYAWRPREERLLGTL